jgi:nucleoside-triphosphatase THEP1
MKLAYTMAPGRGDTDLVLERLAADLAARGLRCCGTVQINCERCDAGPCDMDVRVLPDGAVLRISQDLGPQARGCRLDPAALETAVGLVAVSLSAGADLLIVNKFGKHEAEGRGFRDVIAEAVAMEIPVLVGLNRLNRPAFESFAEGQAVQLPSDPAALMVWVDEVTGNAHELV